MQDSGKATSEDPKYPINSGLLLAIAGTALFGLKSIFIKLAYAQGVDTVTLMTQRMLLATPFYVLMLIWLLRKPETKRPLPAQLMPIIILGFLGYYMSSLLDMQGLNYISAQLERLTLYTYPIITTVLGWLFLKEVITRRIVLALILTYSGVLLLYAHETTASTDNTHLGVILVMGAATTFSCYVVFSKNYIGQFGSRLFTSIAMLASTVFVIVHFFATHDAADLIRHESAWLYAFLLAIFSTLLPSFMVAEAIARIGPAKTSIVGTIGPVFTILMAVIILGEPFGWYHLGGMVLVILGVSFLKK